MLFVLLFYCALFAIFFISFTAAGFAVVDPPVSDPGRTKSSCLVILSLRLHLQRQERRPRPNTPL